MARGPSGRIVIEIDPRLKRELYVELARRGLTMKGWFVEEATRLVQEGPQTVLFAAEPEGPRYRSGQDDESGP